MPEIDIVLVEPLYEGNIGFAARVMKNFGFHNMVLVNPPKLTMECTARSSHAKDVLENAERITLEEVFARSDLCIATTGGLSKSVSNPMRMPYYSVAELREMIKGIDGRIAILFGRENWGLNNEEIARCDIVCTIPTSDEYPILNISHAIGIVCYELAHLQRGEYLLANKTEMDALYAHIERFLEGIRHPVEKRETTVLLAKRVLGRTKLTVREASTLHGILRRTEWHLKHPGQAYDAEDREYWSGDEE
ncbi:MULTISPECIES: RNA methyltransferase [Methanocorpusculum]|jgi:tRNA/rRNA methyltransferase|uniref:RNA methyltransferase n=2 Tax=root TaxID=1 RepID=A0AAX0Q910_9EURY|nr:MULTISPECIES: RNA methyltransferase [Methanocorpusculum]MDD2248755.1 RNA methyltransferase [Methanocorpusculum sp.]MDD2803311.1 RNA methyltransferase [Methanocorpusculum sp.]MDD3047361.1 RNA methyltransferase [Methanocorpusculum sp.]MDD3912597.1 RNA methyltransferase [Methanocorpusculum sp.]MDD4423540.1 RNA methyltransferase [Methanocorpusculum parvum]